ncbi:MAG: hypothetical protein AAGK00_01940 [Pseudomonadota bacterium]
MRTLFSRAAPKPLAATSLVLLLAACEGSGTEDASAAAAPTPSTPAPAAAAAGTPASGTPAPAEDGSTEIVRKACQQPSANRVFFRMGGTVLQVPEQSIENAVPAGLPGNVDQDQLAQEVQNRIAAGQGCPELPMDTILLSVRENLNNPLLEGSIGLLRTRDRSVTRPFAEVTRNLQRQPTQNCRVMQGEVIACIGTETRGERQLPVMYVISTDTSVSLNSGGPLAARCVLRGQEILGCNLVDDYGPDITFDATLAAGEYTTAGLLAAHSAAVARLDALKL